MFVQSPSKSKNVKPNLRQIEPPDRGGSADSFFSGRLKIGGGGITDARGIGIKTGRGIGSGTGTGTRTGNRVGKHNGTGNTGNGSVGTVRANRRKTINKPGKSRLRVPSAGRLILWSLIIGVLGYGYITHVFATQELYSEVNELRRQFENVQANQASQALTYDRMTGPAEVYRRARELGFIDPGPADHVIIID
jgi:hypothetical protein